MLREIPAVFSSEGHLLHGTFFRTSESLSERAPCVLVTGSWLNVKEQIATTWARALAERGLNTFVFDFTGWGESGGESRNLEMPTAKVRDMMQAVEHVSSMSFAGPRVGHLAVCASAQYALRAIARGARIDAFVSIAGWFHDSASVAPFYGANEGVERRM